MKAPFYLISIGSVRFGFRGIDGAGGGGGFETVAKGTRSVSVCSMPFFFYRIGGQGRRC